MNAYQRATIEFRAEYFLRAITEARGNVCRASRKLGVHRNTISRALHAAGYDVFDLRQMMRLHAMKKPPASVSLAEERLRRTA